MAPDQARGREDGERSRVQTWRTEKARLKGLVQEQKECWQKQSWDGVCKLVKYQRVNEGPKG